LKENAFGDRLEVWNGERLFGMNDSDQDHGAVKWSENRPLQFKYSGDGKLGLKIVRTSQTREKREESMGEHNDKHTKGKMR
jgi:hypothetical protein